MSRLESSLAANNCDLRHMHRKRITVLFFHKHIFNSTYIVSRKSCLIYSRRWLATRQLIRRPNGVASARFIPGAFMRLFSINLFVLALLAILGGAYRTGYSGGSLSDHATSTKTSPAQPSELVIPGEKIYPESLTSSDDGRVIIGSISTRTIFVVKPGETKAEAWILPDQETTLGVFGVFADNKNHTLWACFTSIPGLRGATPAPSAVVAYDLQTGTLKQRYPLPTSNAFCNDIAVSADGSTYVTDSRNMEVDRLQKGGHELQPWAGQGGFGPASGFIDGISVVANRVFVNTLGSGKLFAVHIQPDGSA